MTGWNSEMAVLDTLAGLAAFLGWCWFWLQLRRLGTGGLLAGTLAMVGTWFVGGVLLVLYQALVHVLCGLLSVIGMLIPIVLIEGLVALVLVAARIGWERQRAWRFFDR